MPENRKLSLLLSLTYSSHSGYGGLEINILNLENSIFPCVYGRYTALYA